MNEQPVANPRAAGGALIFLGVFLNIPFGILSATFSYPQILRFPTGDILVRFAEGGAALIFTWYAFALAALALLPVSWLVASLHTQRNPGMAATLAGTLAGILQAVGLLRWVFVVPALSSAWHSPETSAATREAIALIFDTIHRFGGVAIGEHLGQLATAVWTVLEARALAGAGWIPRWQFGLALVAALLITLGLSEGFATVIPFDPGFLAFLTPAGFIVLSIWMIVTGITLLRRHPRPTAGPIAEAFAGSSRSSV